MTKIEDTIKEIDLLGEILEKKLGKKKLTELLKEKRLD